MTIVNELERLRALNAELSEKVRQLTKLLDDQMGTPCEQIRHAEEKAELVAALWPFAIDRKESLLGTLGHITREHIDRARAAVAKAEHIHDDRE